MALADFTLDVAKNVFRSGYIYVTADNGNNWYSLGQVKNLRVVFSPLTSGSDTAGRSRQFGFNAEISGVMQQSSDTELNAMKDLTALFIKWTGGGPGGVAIGATQDAVPNTLDDSPAGFYSFGAIVMNIGAELDFGGGESGLPFTIKGHLSEAEFDAGIGSGNVIYFNQ